MPEPPADTKHDPLTNELAVAMSMVENRAIQIALPGSGERPKAGPQAYRDAEQVRIHLQNAGVALVNMRSDR